jgi:hypothetical protein
MAISTEKDFRHLRKSISGDSYGNEEGIDSRQTMSGMTTMERCPMPGKISMGIRIPFYTH